MRCGLSHAVVRRCAAWSAILAGTLYLPVEGMAQPKVADTDPAADSGTVARGRAEQQAQEERGASERARELVDALVWDAARAFDGGDPELALRMLGEAEAVVARPPDTDALLARLRATLEAAMAEEERGAELDALLERAETLVEAIGPARQERFDAYLDELSSAIDSLFETPVPD